MVLVFQLRYHPPMEGYVPRAIEPVLREVVAQFPAVALTGPRQTGKTTLLKQLFPGHAYLTLDDPLTLQRAVEDPELLLQTAGEPLVIDEIQQAPSLLPLLKLRIDADRSRRGRFILTGSQQFGLMRNLSESLAGRVAILELSAFGLPELWSAGASPFAGTSAWEAFELAGLRGLFPEPALLPWGDGPRGSKRWYAAFVQTYLERDIRGIHDIGSLREFGRFLQLLAARCAQQLNFSALATDVGVSANTIKRWVSVLEASRMVFLLPPFHRNLGQRVVKSPKVYFTDIGLVCYLTGISDAAQLLQGPTAGPLFENLCIQEAVKACLGTGERPRFSYLRISGGLEVDLLVEAGDRLQPFEFKLNASPRTSMARALDRFQESFAALSPQPGCLVSLSDRRDALTRQTTLLPFVDFLRRITLPMAPSDR